MNSITNRVNERGRHEHHHLLAIDQPGKHYGLAVQNISGKFYSLASIEHFFVGLKPWRFENSAPINFINFDPLTHKSDRSHL